MLRRAFVALAPLAFLALAGCAQPWLVLAQAVPSPLDGQRRFAVQLVDFTGVFVGEKPEDTYLSEKDGGQREAWGNDKVAINARFAESLMEKATEHGIEVVRATGPNDAPFFIRTRVVRLEPGFYAVVASHPGEVKMEVTITAPDGRLVDRILVEQAAGGFSVTQRFTAAAAGCGRAVARYLAARSRPAE
jgi:hypothetical protein